MHKLQSVVQTAMRTNTGMSASCFQTLHAGASSMDGMHVFLPAVLHLQVSGLALLNVQSVLFCAHSDNQSHLHGRTLVHATLCLPHMQ